MRSGPRSGPSRFGPGPKIQDKACPSWLGRELQPSTEHGMHSFAAASLTHVVGQASYFLCQPVVCIPLGFSSWHLAKVGQQQKRILYARFDAQLRCPRLWCRQELFLQRYRLPGTGLEVCGCLAPLLCVTWASRFAGSHVQHYRSCCLSEQA